MRIKCPYCGERDADEFGYLGAAITVWIFALINYVAYNTSDAILSGDAANVLFGIDTGEAIDVIYHLRSFTRDEELIVKAEHADIQSLLAKMAGELRGGS